MSTYFSSPDEGVDTMNVVGQAKFDGLATDPNFAVEKSFSVVDESVATTLFNVRFKVNVNLI